MKLQRSVSPLQCSVSPLQCSVSPLQCSVSPLQCWRVNMSNPTSIADPNLSWSYSRIDKAVHTMIKPKVLDFRQFYRMWCRSYLLWDWDLFDIVRDVKGNFYEYLNYWKTTFDDKVLPWVFLRPTSWMILYQLRDREIFDFVYMYLVLVL